MNSIDFAGNKGVIEQLGCLADSGRFPHALIIEGDKGLGKMTLARLLAAMLVCRGDSRPCMDCTQCHKAVEHIHPDIFEYCATGGINSFHVDVVRNVINDAYMQPNEAEYKIYLLGNADSMSVSAQNALLKVLEEPPSYVIFIMTVASKSKMLETVLSRSVVVTLDGAGINEGTAYILNHYDIKDEQRVRDTLVSFNGNIGKTVDALLDGSTNELVRVCADMCNALVNDDEYSLLTICSVFQKDRQSIVASMDMLKNIFRDALVGAGADNTISGQPEIISTLKSKLTRQKLIDLIAICDKLKEMALMNLSNQLLITKICYSLRETIGR